MKAPKTKLGAYIRWAFALFLFASFQLAFVVFCGISFFAIFASNESTIGLSLIVVVSFLMTICLPLFFREYLSVKFQDVYRFMNIQDFSKQHLSLPIK